MFAQARFTIVTFNEFITYFLTFISLLLITKF